MGSKFSDLVVSHFIEITSLLESNRAAAFCQLPFLSSSSTMVEGEREPLIQNDLLKT